MPGAVAEAVGTRPGSGGLHLDSMTSHGEVSWTSVRSVEECLMLMQGGRGQRKSWCDRGRREGVARAAGIQS